jgi:hypothetical protein
VIYEESLCGTLYTRLFVSFSFGRGVAAGQEIVSTLEMAMAAKMVPETTEVVAVEMVLVTTTNGAMKVLPR